MPTHPVTCLALGRMRIRFDPIYKWLYYYSLVEYSAGDYIVADGRNEAEMSLSIRVLKERAVGIRDFQANPTRVLERVVGSREPMLVTRRNLPIAALIDVEELERLLEAQAQLAELLKQPETDS